VPDAHFAEPRLAELYGPLHPDRGDLVPHAAIADEFGALAVLDIGCGTGTFACLLAEGGKDVTGVDPAAASLEVARRKPYADRVRWVLGDCSAPPALHFDMATMTGNVAQVFLKLGTVETWATLVEVNILFVSFGTTFVFASDGAVFTSDSTLRFRERAEVIESLYTAGFVVRGVRDAPDRPSLEFVFIASAN
jgi:SAM-dependent methyltransferase